MKTWYYRSMGHEVGPVVLHQLKVAAAQGQIHTDTPVRRENSNDWILATQIQGIFDASGIPLAGEVSKTFIDPFDGDRSGGSSNKRKLGHTYEGEGFADFLSSFLRWYKDSISFKGADSERLWKIMGTTFGLVMLCFAAYYDTIDPNKRSERPLHFSSEDAERAAERAHFEKWNKFDNRAR